VLTKSRHGFAGRPVTMSAVDLVSSRLSPGELEEADLYEPALSMAGSRYKRVVRSKSSVSAIDSSSVLKVVKLEVRAPAAGRSGLLAAQLKGYAFLQSSALSTTAPRNAQARIGWSCFAGLLHSQVCLNCQLATRVSLAENATASWTVQRQC